MRSGVRTGGREKGAEVVQMERWWSARLITDSGRTVSLSRGAWGRGRNEKLRMEVPNPARGWSELSTWNGLCTLWHLPPARWHTHTSGCVDEQRQSLECSRISSCCCRYSCSRIHCHCPVGHQDQQVQRRFYWCTRVSPSRLMHFYLGSPSAAGGATGVLRHWPGAPAYQPLVPVLLRPAVARGLSNLIKLRGSGGGAHLDSQGPVSFPGLLSTRCI